MRRVMGTMLLGATLFFAVGCGPRVSPKELAEQDAVTNNQQEDYYKQNPQATQPAPSADDAASSAVVTSGQPATNAGAAAPDSPVSTSD